MYQQKTSFISGLRFGTVIGLAFGFIALNYLSLPLGAKAVPEVRNKYIQSTIISWEPMSKYLSKKLPSHSATFAPEQVVKGVATSIDKTKQNYGNIISAAAQRKDVDPKLILAVITVESHGNPNAVNIHAQGLMQLLPAAAKEMGVTDRKNPWQNIFGGAGYLKKLRDDYGFDSMQENILAYNQGPGGARDWLEHSSAGEHPYVVKVMKTYHQITQDKDLRRFSSRT